MSLDKKDQMILKELQGQGRLSNVALAARVNLSEAACLRRVRSLEEAGVIAGYAALVDPQKVGRPASVFVQITLQQERQGALEDFERAVAELPEVMECYLMTGEYDYLLRLAVKDLEDFERIHRHALTTLPGVVRVHSSFALRTVTKRTALPL